MRGAKPKKNAIRRGGPDAPELLEARPVEPRGIEKPDEVARSASLSVLWDQTVGASGAFRPQDVPALTQYVFQLETARQCRANAMDESGKITVLVGKGEPDENGRYVAYVENPWLKAMREAEALALKLADQLGLTPLARARLGLTNAASAAAAISIADQIDRAMRARDR